MTRDTNAATHDTNAAPPDTNAALRDMTVTTHDTNVTTHDTNVLNLTQCHFTRTAARSHVALREWTSGFLVFGVSTSAGARRRKTTPAAAGPESSSCARNEGGRINWITGVQLVHTPRRGAV